MSQLNIADMLLGVASQRGDAPALVSTDAALSHAALAQRAARAAAEFREQGIRHGDAVGVALRDNTETFACVMALWMLGATAAPMDFRTQPAKRSEIATQFGLAAIVGDRAGVGDHQSIRIGEDWSDIIARHDPAPRVQTAPAPALIQLSSGTTGEPSGLVVDHTALLLRTIFPIETGLRNTGGAGVTQLPLSWGFGMHFTLTRLLSGGSVRFLPHIAGAAELDDAIGAENASAVGAVPTMVRGLLELHGDRSELRYPRLETLYCAGAPTHPEEKRLAQTKLTPGYTEVYAANSVGRISILRGADMERAPDSAGRIVPQLRVQAVDENDQELPLGEPGQLRARGPGMAERVICANPEAQGDQIRDGWAYPGDVGAIDADGFLRLLGRSADVIIRGGVNTHPAEIERVLSQLPGVSDVAATGFNAQRQGEEIAAFVTGAGVTVNEVEAWCRARLTSDKRPRRIFVVSDLPRNAHGKIVRRELRRRIEAGEV